MNAVYGAQLREVLLRLMEDNMTSRPRANSTGSERLSSDSGISEDVFEEEDDMSDKW